jgi:hypothetical protein
MLYIPQGIKANEQNKTEQKIKQHIKLTNRNARKLDQTRNTSILYYFSKYLQLFYLISTFKDKTTCFS